MKISGISLQESPINIIMPTNEEITSSKGQSLASPEKAGKVQKTRLSVMGGIEITSPKAGIYEAEERRENEFTAMVETIKGQLDALANQLTGADYDSMKEYGYDPKTDEVGRVETVVDQIRTKLAAFCEDYETYGYVDQKDIESLAGNTALASSIAHKLSSYDLPITEDNIKEVKETMELASSLTDVTREQAGYFCILCKRDFCRISLKSCSRSQSLVCSSILADIFWGRRHGRIFCPIHPSLTQQILIQQDRRGSPPQSNGSCHSKARRNHMTPHPKSQ